MSVNWNILAEAPNPGNAFAQGMRQGQELRRQQEGRNALASYLKNPNDPNVLSGLAQLDPEIAVKVLKDQRDYQRTQQIGQLTQRAVTGDHAAMDGLAGLDIDTWGKLDAHVRERVKQATEFMGNAVLQISRLPEQQREQAWTHYVQQAEASGLDIPTQYERYSPESLNAAAAEAGTMQKMLEQFEPKYQAVAPGGTLQNTNPLAGAVGQQAQMPQPGQVEDGFVFKGGNPGDPNAWEPVGGAGSGPRNFP